MPTKRAGGRKRRSWSKADLRELRAHSRLASRSHCWRYPWGASSGLCLPHTPANNYGADGFTEWSPGLTSFAGHTILSMLNRLMNRLASRMLAAKSLAYTRTPARASAAQGRGREPSVECSGFF